MASSERMVGLGTNKMMGVEMVEEDLEILKSAGLLLLWEETYEKGKLKQRKLIYPKKEVNKKDA